MPIRHEIPRPTRHADIGVLLVEDDPGDACLVRHMLDEEEKIGFQVSHAERLEDVLERLHERAFGVVLLDLSLPDSHGLGTLFRVREAAPEVPGVVLSGLDDEEMALRALQNGAQDYLVKGQGDGDLMSRAIRYAIERKRAEERLAYVSQYDHLTGVANRVLFEDRLRRALVRADRDGTLVTLLFVDLDRFKTVNDSFGHALGDGLLKEAADRIPSCSEKSDTVARMGADEFAVIVEGLSDAQDAVPLAEAIVGAFAETFCVDGHELPVTASVGIAVRPPSEGEDLLSHAIAAVNRTKQIGRNSYQFYTSEMNAQAFERMVFEASLRRAVDRGEFLLHYQPQVEVGTGRIVGAEALLRWRHPELGIIPPDRFIPMLEENGLIVRVGEWALRAACSDAKGWQDAGFPLLEGRRQPLRAPVQPGRPHREGRRRFGRDGPRRAQLTAEFMSIDPAPRSRSA